MGRRLPDDPVKRRTQVFKRVYQNYYHWQSDREAGYVSDILTVEGEDIYIGDLMTGIDTLPPQQKAAFQLICLEGYTESAATKKILPNSKWSTPVQQYSDDGLKKMIAAYDAKQNGTWDPAEAVKKKRRPKQKDVPPVSTPVEDRPEVPEDVADETRRARIDTLDWTISSDDDKSLAAYIQAHVGLPITGEMVKAIRFWRNPWRNSPEQVAHRKAVQEAKDAEKAKYAYETPEQRANRFAAQRALKSAEAAQKRAEELQQQVRQLRVEAGLDPDTGEPVNG